jgi:hypothetical protein
MPTPRKTTTAAKKAPAKKAAPSRSRTRRTETPQPAGPVGIAAKRAQVRGEDGPQVDPYAATVWGADGSIGALEDLTLPSGQRCLAQRPGPEGLMAAGMLDDLDMLSTVLPQIAGKGKAAKKFNPAELMKNPAMFGQAMQLINRVTVHVVVKPELTPEPTDPRDKEVGKIYPSSVSLEDKMFLFNWAAGGTRDLATFRERLEASVADLDAGEDVEDQA